MVVKQSGKNWKGEVCYVTLDGYLYETLSNVKEVVSKKDFDYVAIVSGDPGMGKSNFAITCCKYLDPNFNIDSIAMTADEFIQKSTDFPPGSAIMLDESFASLNSKVGRSADFLRILNHLQIIRQKNHYIFLCLPNFFDLQKSISIYRSRHLFVVYGGDFGTRGRFVAFGKDEKRLLYIKGLKFMDYNCVPSNYYGTFGKQKAIDNKDYEAKKLKHLLEQNKQIAGNRSPVYTERNNLILFLSEQGIKTKRIAEAAGMELRNIQLIIRKETDKKNNYPNDISTGKQVAS